MKLSLPQSLMMGLFSGLTEPMPLSAEAHRGLLRYMFGAESVSPLLTLLCHVAVLAVLMAGAPLELSRLHRARKQLRLPPRRRTHQPELLSANTLKLLGTAAPIAAIGTLLGTYLDHWADRMVLLAAVLAFGGLLLGLPGHFRTANKDARHLERTDGVILGLAAALGAVPGLSPVGLCMAAASIREVDRRYALRFSWLLLVFRLAVLIAYDALRLISAGLDLGWMELLHCIAGAAAAAVGAWMAVRMMQSFVRTRSVTLFSCYSWGMAALCLILYLAV